MRIHHDCGRGLADVTHSDHNVTLPWDGLVVVRRPNVDQTDYRAWVAAGWGHPPLGERAKDADDPMAMTYTWRCRCAPESPVSRRHEQISKCWQRHVEDSPRVVHVTLGADL